MLNIIYTFKDWNWQTMKYTDRYDNNPPLDVILFANKSVESDFVWILQFLFVNIQLILTVGLCFDGGKSCTSGFFNAKLLQVKYQTL